MVHNMENTQESTKDRLSMRHSIMIWVAGAALGWVVAVVSVWTAMNTTDSNIADNTPNTAEKMEQIMPAAGDKVPKDKIEN